MAGRRHGLVAGALLAVGAVAGGLALSDGAVEALEARAVAWTTGEPAAEPGPAAAPRPTKRTAKASPAAALPGASAAKRSRTAKLACTCKKRSGKATLKRIQGPQVVTEQDPPSARLVGPGQGGVDRGIADTGTHSDGTWPDFDPGRRYHPGSQTNLAVTPSAAGATGRIAISWLHIGDPATITYRVGYQPQTWVKPATGASSWTYPAITWVNVPPITGEGTQTWTLNRATRGVKYTVWLEVDVSTPEDTIGSTRMLLGQQSGVLVP